MNTHFNGSHCAWCKKPLVKQQVKFCSHQHSIDYRRAYPQKHTSAFLRAMEEREEKFIRKMNGKLL